jgi:hypothetical protein
LQQKGESDMITSSRHSRKRKLTYEERKALYATMPPGNKYVEAARKTQGHLTIYDPAFML